LIPALLKAYQDQKNNPAYQSLAEPIKLLADWNRNSSETSVATTVAIEWAQKIWPTILRGTGAGENADQVDKTKYFAALHPHDNLLKPLVLAVIDDLTKKFGTWQKPFGEINRYQRLRATLQKNLMMPTKYPLWFCSFYLGLPAFFCCEKLSGTI
jgi:acyl-homoserine-lactone acylase